jgi:hypothetical protein
VAVTAVTAVAVKLLVGVVPVVTLAQVVTVVPKAVAGLPRHRAAAVVAARQVT